MDFDCLDPVPVVSESRNIEHFQKKLSECGGFEIMRSVFGSSKLVEVLVVPPGGYNAPYLKSCSSIGLHQTNTETTLTRATVRKR